jgi:hypothetical protein
MQKLNEFHFGRGEVREMLARIVNSGTFWVTAECISSAIDLWQKAAEQTAKRGRAGAPPVEPLEAVPSVVEQAVAEERKRCLGIVKAHIANLGHKVEGSTQQSVAQERIAERMAHLREIAREIADARFRWPANGSAPPEEPRP